MTAKASRSSLPASKFTACLRPSRKPYGAAGLAVLVLVVIAGLFFLAIAPVVVPAAPRLSLSLVGAAEAATPAPAAAYVGAAVCKSCHEAEFKAWSGSNHDRAMQVATASTVLGNFADVKFRHKGAESSFFKHGDKFMVRTDGPDGKLTDYEISHTFGVYPLQQYLVPFSRGRYQVLPIAWDSRPQGEGGQRWFHLYPTQKTAANDPLHWTGIYQNWALQCAACHSTNLRKGYDPVSDTYKTTFSEINVACESCHGQGSTHVDWARNAKAPYPAQADKGLPAMKSNWKEAWKFPTREARFAVRDNPAEPAAMNACAACHARRSALSEDIKPGAPLEDSHRLALPMAPMFHVDGQQREENYVWASFLQSKMHQNGVTCMDCHEPHSQKLRTTGNALCTRCHQAEEFDAPAHHKHLAGGKGAQCVTCHMPTQNYMVIHARQDHSIRVPRPDLSLSLGSPNACTQCHADKKPQWAATAMDAWYGRKWRDRPHFGKTFNSAETQGAKALPALLELANNTTQPGIVRATALTLAQPYAHAGTLQAARALLKDSDPQVRIAALGMIEPADRINRVLSVSPMLADPVRGVRIEAARILADIPDNLIAESHRAARGAALKEYEASLALEADWPSGSLNLGNLRMRQGRAAEAVIAFERAIARDRKLAGAYANLADAWRQQGREADSEKVLRRGLASLPQDADLHHALGLLLTRKKESAAALKEFIEAARLAPMNPRYVYVHAIAVHSAGKRDEALAILRGANKKHPGNVDILSTLVSMNSEAGDKENTLRYARKLGELLPDDAGVKRLIAELEAR